MWTQGEVEKALTESLETGSLSHGSFIHRPLPLVRHLDAKSLGETSIGPRRGLPSMRGAFPRNRTRSNKSASADHGQPPWQGASRLGCPPTLGSSINDIRPQPVEITDWTRAHEAGCDISSTLEQISHLLEYIQRDDTRVKLSYGSRHVIPDDCDLMATAVCFG